MSTKGWLHTYHPQIHTQHPGAVPTHLFMPACCSPGRCLLPALPRRVQALIPWAGAFASRFPGKAESLPFSDLESVPSPSPLLPLLLPMDDPVPIKHCSFWFASHHPLQGLTCQVALCSPASALPLEISLPLPKPAVVTPVPCGEILPSPQIPSICAFLCLQLSICNSYWHFLLIFRSTFLGIHFPFITL